MNAMRKKNFSRSIFISLLMLMLFVLVSKANGQGYQSFKRELDEIVENTKWRIGPFRIFPQLFFRDIGYDNNVYRRPDFYEPVSDFRFTLSLPVTTHLIIKDTMILSFTVTPEYVFFAQEERERSFNIGYSPAIKLRFLKRFVLSGSYLHQRSRVRASSEFDERVEVNQNEVRSQLFYETARRTSIGFTGTVRDLNHQDIEAPGTDTRYSQELDRTESIGQLELFYPVFSDTYLFVNGGFGDYDFKHPLSRWKDSYSYFINSGLQFPLLGRIRGTLSLGYKILQPYRSNKRGYSGLVGNTRIDYRIRRFAFRFIYARDAEFSYWTNNVFFIEDQYGAGISFYLTQHIRLDYDFLLGNSLYPEPETIRLPDESYVERIREDEIRTHSAGVVIRVFRNTGIGIFVNYWERESNFFFNNRNRMFVGGYLTYDF